MSGEGAEYRRRAEAARVGFRAALRHAASLQHAMLRASLEENATSAFGREHGFGSISSEAEFRAAVPIRGYAELSPWIERAAAGEAQVLTSVEPAVFLTSSGSTGESKRVPMTPPYVERSFMPFFFAALGNTLHYCPASISHPDATLNLKWDPLRAHRETAGGIPAMGASQVDFAKRFGQALAAEPGTAASSARIPVEIHDELERLYYRLRVAAEHDVRALIGINPSMVAALPLLLRRWWERLLADLRDGTVCGQASRPPLPARARQLAELARYVGEISPALLWPKLEVVFCWTGGATKLYRDELRRVFGGRVQVLPAPLAASEAPVAVAIDRHPSAGVLFVPGAYYEFVDADRELAPAAATLRWDELAVGQELHVVVTHLGGLYRYAMGDVVRVVDHVDGVPRLEYACRNRAAQVGAASVREGQIVEAVSAALAPGGVAARGAVINVKRAGVPQLAVAVELATAAPSAGDAAALAERIDLALCAAIPSYRQARSQGAVIAPEVVWLPPDTLSEDWCVRVRGGVRPTQVKDRIFVTDADWQALTAVGVSGVDGLERIAGLDDTAEAVESAPNNLSP
jgi:GH3 auxin-responsive promoter